MSNQAFDHDPDNSGSRPVPMPNQSASQLGRYQVVATLGRGGMGNIHLGVAEGLGDFRKPVVLKELRSELLEDKKFVHMFFNEVKLASRLSHPNVVHTLEAGEDKGRYFMAMEFLDGQPYSEVLQAATYDGRLTLGTRLMVLADALAGLHYAHELRDYDGTDLHIVHSDVSPQNIFVTYDGQVKVVDFGIAKFANSTRPDTGNAFVGRFGYAAPELVRGHVLDRRTDIFAAGIMIWEAVTLRRFVRGSPNEAMVSARLNGTEPRLADVVPDVEPLLAAICDKAMHIDRHRRYATAAELRRALLQYLSISNANVDSQALGQAMSDAFVVQQKAMHRLIAAHVGDAPPPAPQSADPAEERTSGPEEPRRSAPSFEEVTEVADLTELVESSRGDRALPSPEELAANSMPDTPSPIVRHFTIREDGSLPRWPPPKRRRRWLVGMFAAGLATIIAVVSLREEPAPDPFPATVSQLPESQPMEEAATDDVPEAPPTTAKGPPQRRRRFVPPPLPSLAKPALGSHAERDAASQTNGGSAPSSLATSQGVQGGAVQAGAEHLDEQHTTADMNSEFVDPAEGRMPQSMIGLEAQDNLPTSHTNTTTTPASAVPGAGQDLRQLRQYDTRRKLDLEDPF